MKDKTPEVVAPASTFPTTLPAKVESPNNFKAVKRLTRDVASITRLGEAIIQCQGELFTVEIESKFTPGVKQPILAINVLDCLRAEEYCLLCGAVLGSTLKREGEPLEGRYFAIRDAGMPKDKRYRKVDVVALERVE